MIPLKHLHVVLIYLAVINVFTDDVQVALADSGHIDLSSLQWTREPKGFKDTPTSVRKTVETIKTHPLVPKDIVVRGFIIDSETGALEEVKT